MKKLIPFLFVLFSGTVINAQNSTLVVFSDEGFPFRLMMNGQFMNNNPETNVKLPNITPVKYSVKIFFKDTANGTLTDEIYMNPGMEQVYVVKKKQISETSRSVKKFGEEWKANWDMQSKEQAKAKQEEIDKKKEKFVLRKQSETQIATATPAPATTASASAAPTTSKATAANSTSATSVNSSVSATGTTATTKTSANGVNMNVSINTGGVGYTETTTTTTTTSTSTGSGNVYVMPGYSGPTGCPMPMNEADFAGVKNSINAKTFEDSKLTIAKQVIQSNCILSAQVREIMKLFTFEDNKLEFAKYAYGYTFDLGNYYKVNDAFQFESSIDELNTYINSRKK